MWYKSNNSSGNTAHPSLYPPHPRSLETDVPVMVCLGIKWDIERIFSWCVKLIYISSARTIQLYFCMIEASSLISSLLWQRPSGLFGLLKNNRWS